MGSKTRCRKRASPLRSRSPGIGTKCRPRFHEEPSSNAEHARPRLLQLDSPRSLSKSASIKGLGPRLGRGRKEPVIALRLYSIRWVNTHLSGSIHSAPFTHENPFSLCGTPEALLPMEIGRFAAPNGHPIARRKAFSRPGSSNHALRSCVAVSSERSVSSSRKQSFGLRRQAKRDAALGWRVR